MNNVEVLMMFLYDQTHPRVNALYLNGEDVTDRAKFALVPVDPHVTAMGYVELYHLDEQGRIRLDQLTMSVQRGMVYWR